MFGHQIKNVLKTGRRRHVNANSIPTVTVSMRGDGNCLFRTFSYVLFGVQSYHNDVRNKVVGFMKENKHLLQTMEADPKYLKRSRMEHEGSWGTDTEIRTFATICNTTIFVYCKHGMNDKNNDNYVWLPYPPLHEGKNESNSKCIFIMNIGNLYEPVLDVTEDIYSRTPYIYIKNFVLKKYHQYISTRGPQALTVT